MSSKSVRWLIPSKVEGLIRQVQRRRSGVSLRAGSGQALRFHSGQALRLGSGQAYVEFVVVLPAVLLLLLLVWEFSYFGWSRMVVSSATFEAARQVAAGEPEATGYAVYNEILDAGMGRMAEEHRGNFSLTVQPSLRSVHAVAAVPYHWPLGLEALMGGEEVNLTLKASAFFRLERFFPGPPDTFE